MPVEGLFNTTIDVLGASIDLRARNQNLITSNIANAETPGYIPKGLEFEQELQSAVKKSTVRGSSSVSSRPEPHSGHIALRGASGATVSRVKGHVVETPAKTPGRDGNAVELENEMSKMMQNQVLFNASVQLLAKKFEGLRTALREGK